MAQLVAIGWLFVLRFNVPPPSLASTQATSAQSAKEFTDPFAEVSTLPSATAVPTSTPPPAPPKPSPISQQALGHTAAPVAEPTQEDRVNEALEQGRLLRDRGDTYAAVTKLREAQALDQNNPSPLYELAMTYEKMGFTEKASETWKRIYDMGDAAGVYYSAAEAKLNASKAQALLQAQPKATDMEAASTAPPAEAVGMNGVAKLGFETITKTEESDPQCLQKLTLHLGVRAKARARIDVADVTVKVLFYDLVDANKLDGTNATIHYQWQNSADYWSERDLETLDVMYVRPRPPQGEPIEDRKYYGYIAAIYYKNALQDFRSDPARLAQRVPPPRTLSE